MATFVREYRRAFATLGYELKPRDRCAASRIDAAAKRLGIRVPEALRDYYLVAGCERQFNRIYNRLLRPDEWFVDHCRLVFMEENQAVVLWGVSATDARLKDPPVFQGVNDEPIRWHREHDNCSVFLTVMLHWHGAYGAAMRFANTATVPRGAQKILDREWRFAGTVNKMRAYNRPGQAVCFLKWDDPIQQMKGGSPWRVFAGASSKDGLEEIASQLNLTWEAWGA